MLPCKSCCKHPCVSHSIFNSALEQFCRNSPLTHNTTASKRRRSFLVQCCSANHGANHGGHDSHTNTALHLKMVCKPQLLMHTTTWWNSVADQNSNITEITLAYTILLFIRYCRWPEHRHRYPEQVRRFLYAFPVGKQACCGNNIGTLQRITMDIIADVRYNSFCQMSS